MPAARNTVETATRTPTATATARPPATPTPVPTVPGYPLSTRTGIADIDGVLDALESREAERIAGLFVFVDVACVAKQEQIGALPLCPEGVAVGTPLSAYGAGFGCEGGYVLESEAAEFAARLVQADAKLYAVVRPALLPASWRGFLGRNEFAIVFAFLVNVEGSPVRIGTSVVGVTGGRIVHNVGYCGGTPEERVKGVPAEAFVLPPP